MKRMIRLLLLVLGFQVVSAAWATLPTITNTPSLIQYPINAKLQLVNGTLTGTLIDCTTTGANGSYCANGGVITGINVTSTDTSAQTLTCTFVNNSVTYDWFVIQVPINAGNLSGTPPFQILTVANLPGGTLDSNQNYTIAISNTDKITCAAGAVTSGKHINIYLLGGAF